MSGIHLFQDIKEALAEHGEDFEAIRDGNTQVIKGKRNDQKQEIWFAGDVDLRIGDLLKSKATSIKNELLVVDLRPRVEMNIQIQLFAKVEDFTKYQVQLARERTRSEAQLRKSATSKYESVKGVVLETQQETLLSQLVEAMSNLPDGKREAFHFYPELSSGDLVVHSGLMTGSMEVWPADLTILVNEGLLSEDRRQNQVNFLITPRGFLYHEFMKAR